MHEVCKSLHVASELCRGVPVNHGSNQDGERSEKSRQSRLTTTCTSQREHKEGQVGCPSEGHRCMSIAYERRSIERIADNLCWRSGEDHACIEQTAPGLGVGKPTSVSVSVVEFLRMGTHMEGKYTAMHQTEQSQLETYTRVVRSELCTAHGWWSGQLRHRSCRPRCRAG